MKKNEVLQYNMAEIILLGMMMSSMSSLVSSILAVASEPMDENDNNYEPDTNMNEYSDYEPDTNMNEYVFETEPIVAEADSASVEYVTPNVDTVPISQDCEGVWTDWDSCKGICGGQAGTQSRMWSVTTLPRGGGAVCPEITLETRDCTTPACPEWETRTSGSGIFRKRYKLINGTLIDTIHNADSVGVCKTRCVEDPECVGFNRKMTTCKLYSGNVEFKKDGDLLFPSIGYKITRNT